MPRSQALRNVLLAASLSLASTAAFAVDVNGRIKGTVTDPVGATIPNAQVIATNQATGVRFTTTSQANGDYQFQQLPIGTYTISASAPGFKGFSASGIVINIDQEYVEAVKLDVGGGTETVSVQADAVQVNTTDMQLNNVVDRTEFVELPLLGRDFTNLELILPGVQASSDRFGTFSVNGSQSQQSSYLINGADSNDLPLNSISFTPNLDALQQFNLVTGPLNAEYDRNSGAVVSTAVIQGTNAFHGDAFEFYRDTFLNTKNYFQTTAPKYHENIFGGTVGGPALRDKLFFFVAYQGQRASTPQTSYGSVNVPSAAQLGGDFSSTTFSTNVIPASITIPGCVSGVQTFASCFGASGLNGQVPTAAINPISASFLSKYVPAANNGPSGYVFNPTQSVSQDQIIGRIDYNLNPKNQFTFVGIYQTNPTSEVIPFTGATLPGFGEVDLSHNQQYTFDYIRQLSASAVNDFSVHYTRFNYGAVVPQNIVAPSSFGFSITPQDTVNQSVPYQNIAGYFALGFSTNGPQPRVDSTYQLDDNFSKTIGHHNLKFGYDGRRYNVSNPFDGNNNGGFTFSASGNPDTSGNALLDYELGIPKSYNQGTGNTIIAKAYLNYMYAQDTWKATPNLTISYGLGFQIDTPLGNLQHNGEGVTCYIPGQQSKIFSTAPMNLNFPGDPGCNNAGGAVTRYKDFGPRIGFAYAPDLGTFSGGNSKKLSIRGGYGIYYNRSEEETALQNLGDPPYAVTSHGATDSAGVTNPQFANPFYDLNVAGPQNRPNRFPIAFPTPGQAVDFSNFEPFDLSQPSRNFRSPYAQNFQLTVEREFPSQIVARVSYVASLGRHNQVTIEGNPITQAGHDACLADPTCVANASVQNLNYPTHTQFGYADLSNGGINEFPSIGLISTVGSSSYHSLQAGLDKGLSHGLSLQASYTYSHALDDASSFENSGFGGVRGYNQYDTALNYGDSAYDARHRFVLAPIYIVPFKAGGKAYSARNLLGAGWQISGIATFATGFPFDISYGGFGSFNSLYCSSYSYYACPDVPVQIGKLQKLNLRTPDPNDGFSNFFYGETAATVDSGASFADEPVGSFGNIHRNPYHGPGILNTDVVVAKNIPLSGDGVRRIQLRLTSSNVFNHTQFNLPDGNLSDGTPSQGGTFGQITGAAQGRQTQLAAKIYF